MAIEEGLEYQITTPSDLPEDKVFDTTLRPQKFDDYIGQAVIKDNLGIAIAAAKKRNEPLDHVLLAGPPGLGKTTLATIIAKEIGANIHITSGPAIERSGDLASVITNLSNGDVLFIDEIHRLNKTVEEMLYSAMEDFALDIVLGKGPGARSMRLDLPHFTLVGATTKPGGISAPLRDRFGLQFRLSYYTHDDLQEIIRRSAAILNTEINGEGLYSIAQRSRGTPRIANRLLKRVRDYVEVKGNGSVDKTQSETALDYLSVDALGLDDGDRRVLTTMIEKFNGGPVGISAIAAACMEDEETIEDVHEPYLMQIGFLQRTPKGRVVTPRALEHLGITDTKNLF
jgi:Holliday junction DNA helicase RuvB